jgi:secondary thiamine-phosphate synthase enzyme
MAVRSHTLEIDTRGDNEVLDLTERITACVSDSGVTHGIAVACVVGSTAGITTTEFEPGLVTRDLKAAFEGIAPERGAYLHEQTWHDDNGHSHVRASLLGPSITVPVLDGRLALGTWQQIVLIDFDTRPRQRRVVVQIIGESSTGRRPRIASAQSR